MLNPGRIVVTGANAGEYQVTTSDGRRPARSRACFDCRCRPGSYVVNVEGQLMKVDLVDGQTHTIDVQ